MTEQVFTQPGMALAPADAIRRLMALVPNARFPRAKALGSIGGAVNSGFIHWSRGMLIR